MKKVAARVSLGGEVEGVTGVRLITFETKGGLKWGAVINQSVKSSLSRLFVLALLA